MQGVLSREDELELARPARAASRLDNVVVAVDDSDASRDAVVLAAKLAASFGSRLHLVHALAHPPHGSFSLTEGSRVAEAFELGRSRLDAEMAAIHSTRASSIEHVLVGHVAREIVATAEVRGADLIVVGSRNRPGAHRLEEGTAGEIVRRSHVPVLVVHEGTTLPPPGYGLFRRPLAAVDEGDASLAALRTLAVLARGAEIVALRAISHDPSWNGAEACAALRARARAIAAERARLAAWLHGALGEPGPASRALVGAGDPATVIVDTAVGGGHDLVSCGTHARRDREAGRLGSVAEAVLDGVAVPVLVLREATEAPPRH
jgi:nucleotide-binding universal stress UspA family protein